MPNRGSWNGHWSQENDRHMIFRENRLVPKDVIGKDFIYSWEDGWTACVNVSKVDTKSANKLKKINKGFCGYDWMVSSIIKNGKIKRPE